MKSVSIVALAALLSTGALAVPTLGQHAPAHAKLHRKRDVVWVTETDIEIVTVVKTVFADGSVPTGPAYPIHRHTGSATTVTSYSAPVPAPSSSSSTESEVESESSSATDAYTAPSSAAAPEPTTTATYENPAPEPTTTTSTYQAPVTTTATTSAYQAPAPTTIQTTTSSPAPAPTAYATSTEAPAPSATSTSGPAGSYGNSGSSASGTGYTGDFTYYVPGIGACGVDSADTDAVVAISHELFDLYTINDNPNTNPLCGRTLSLTTMDGTTSSAKIVDRCVGCTMGSLDLTSTLFATINNKVSAADALGAGRLSGMKWSFD